VLIHTGQHYDARMSDVFFTDLGLPEPDVNLRVGSGTHGEQTAAVITGVERELTTRRPALLVVYGDVNSTLGAALAAAKLRVPIAHVEAGLRSFDNDMPEEINRRLTDQLCDLLFATSAEAIGYLGNEGINVQNVHLVGNTMIDTLPCTRAARRPSTPPGSAATSASGSATRSATWISCPSLRVRAQRSPTPSASRRRPRSYASRA
jgi:UDP-N-acetylglucosamine 2-epimerase